jgi:hypothetical protein
MNDATASHAAVLRAYPDDLLCSWVALPGSTDLLSERERAHALGLLAGSGSAAAAVYVRERLTGGDLPAEARRIALEDGAIVKIDGRIHYVERRTGERTWRLRGIARGVVDLAAPHNPDLVLRWWAWRGGIGARNARLLTLTRDAAGHFTTAR